MYLVGLYIYLKNDTRTLQCQINSRCLSWKSYKTHACTRWGKCKICILFKIAKCSYHCGVHHNCMWHWVPTWQGTATVSIMRTIWRDSPCLSGESHEALCEKKKKVQFLKVATSGCKMLKLEIRPAKFKSSPPFLENNVNRSVPLKQVKLHVLNETALPRLTSGDNSQWTANVSQSFRPLSSWRHSNALKHNCCRSLVTNTAKYFTEHGTVLSFSLKKMLMLEWSLLGCLYEGE